MLLEPTGGTVGWRKQVSVKGVVTVEEDDRVVIEIYEGEAPVAISGVDVGVNVHAMVPLRLGGVNGILDANTITGVMSLPADTSNNRR